MFNAIFTLLTFIPPALAALAAWYLTLIAKPAPISDQALAAVFSLNISALVSTGCAIQLLYDFYRELKKPTRRWLFGLNIIMIPPFVAAIAMGAMIGAWGLAEVVVQFHQASLAHESYLEAVLKSVPSLLLTALTIYIFRTATKPSKVQEMWKLAASPRGEGKLQKMLNEAVAKNDLSTLDSLANVPKLPRNLLRQLGQHPADNIRAAVAYNANTPDDLLDQLMRDTSLDVRRAVIFSDRATIERLRILADSPEAELREAASTRLAGKLAE